MISNTKAKAQEYNYVKIVRNKYRAEYNRKNPDKVKQWRKNAIVNAYKKLIAAEPQYKI